MRLNLANYRTVIMAVLLSVLLTGCSYSFIYNNLDWWVDWYLDDYVVLNKAQKKAFEQKFEAIHLWHRNTQLVRYANQLAEFKSLLAADVTEQQIQQHLELMSGHWQVLREKLAPDLVELTSLLSDEQKQDIIAAIDQENKDIKQEREDKTLEQRYQQTCNRQQQQFRKWVGQLTPTQQHQVCELSKQYTSTFDYWMEYRGLWLNNLKEAFAPSLSQEVYRQLFTELLVNPEILRTQQYNDARAHNSEVYSEILADLLNHLTPKQKNRLQNRIDSLLDDLHELAEQD
ncbi:DUF6279 family lipoprotein [Colwellia sp. MEBiC06753]